jgi:hypothetical protein
MVCVGDVLRLQDPGIAMLQLQPYEQDIRHPLRHRPQRLRPYPVRQMVLLVIGLLTAVAVYVINFRGFV